MYRWIFALALACGSADLDYKSVHVRLVGGESFSTEEHRSEVIVLNFWAAWCPPCRAEAPVLTSAHERLVAQGRGRVVGLAVDTRSIPSASALGMHYPIGLATPDVIEGYQVENLPSTFVLFNGRVVRRFVGEVHAAQLQEAINDAR